MNGNILHLLRHGRPVVHGRLLGLSDAEPVEEGISDCVIRAQGLAVTEIVTSDLRRSLLAAERIATEHGLPLRVDPRWRELDFGAWDGKATCEIDEYALGRFWNDPDAFPPPGGERWSDLVARVRSAMGVIREPALVVTHGGAMRAALHILCGFDQPQLWAFDLPYAARIDLRLWRGPQTSAQIIGLAT